MKTYIGIDNGLDGAWAVNRDGMILHRDVLPTVKLGKGREIDTREFRKMLKPAIDGSNESPGNLVFAIEPAQKHSPGKMALCSTWFTFGRLIEMLIQLERPYHEVPPQRWQRTFWTRPKLPKGTKFDTKAAALNAAKKLWPTETFLKSQRSTVPHDGIVDAALIAEYARRAQL